MNYEIVDKEQFEIVGIKKRVTINHHGINKEIKAMNEQITAEFISELETLPNLINSGLINGSLNYENRHLDQIGKMDRIIGVAVTSCSSDLYDVVVIPTHRWAIFKLEGIFPQVLQEGWAYIKDEWLPTSGYQIGLDIELTRHLTKAIPGQPYVGEVWLAIENE